MWIHRSSKEVVCCGDLEFSNHVTGYRSTERAWVGFQTYIDATPILDEACTIAPSSYLFEDLAHLRHVQFYLCVQMNGYRVRGTDQKHI